MVYSKECEGILWKKSEIDKPSWMSRWGLGRPGSLINCSVMSNILFDSKCDIHSTGCGDLHACSKNYCGNKSWVNYELGDGATGEMNQQNSQMSLWRP
ncbi:unnamed protein product [Adineta steineri]|uniref:tRNA synthetases class I catalytic domain-containing protein n=1 Tax=Adineta steineri TaxID=433720 RepID=A0A814QSU2_9BILA|nr:unnamed protein product [Adineta steineri]CAF4015975.1 unnamed protein product [Adineta steineri]